LTERRADIARAALEAQRLQRAPQGIDTSLVNRKRIVVGDTCLREDHLAPLKLDDECHCAPGCINPAKSLTRAKADIDFIDSRTRVIAIIDDMKTFLGASFPKRNGRPIPNASLVIDGEP
jgi:hypothetical protein